MAEPPGLTLGLATSDLTGVGFVAGLWAGMFHDITTRTGWPFGSGEDLDCPDAGTTGWTFLSGAVGVRYVLGAWEFYLTPKFGGRLCFEFAS